MNEEYVLVHHGVKGMKWGVIRDRSKADSFSRKSNKADKLYKKSYDLNERGKYVKASRVKDKADKQYRSAEKHLNDIKNSDVKNELKKSDVMKSINSFKEKGVDNNIKKGSMTARKNVIVRDFLERHRNTTIGVIGTGAIVAGSVFASSFAALPVTAISAGMLAGEALTVAGFISDNARETYREQRNLKYNKRR